MLIALTLVAALAGSDPDGVVSTAPADTPGSVLVGAVAPTSDATPSAVQAQAITPHGLTTDQQIARWLAGRPSELEPFSDDPAPIDDRKMHGFVSGSIGTDDFSAVSVGVSLPVGETGRLDLSYSQTRNGYGYGYPYGGHGYGLGGYGYGYGYDDEARVSSPWVEPFGAGHPPPGWGRRLSLRDDRRSLGLSYQSRAQDEGAPFSRR